VRQGQWRVPAEPPYVFIDNTREYLRRYKNPNPPCLAGEKAYFHALLTFLKQEDIKVVVVGMPSLQSNRDILPPTFWSQFKNYLQTETVASGGSFIDLFSDKRFESHDFLDTVHLNRWGGGKLIAVLAQELAKNSEITAVLGNQPQNNQQAVSTKSQKQWQ
jgi:hypothetical protein